MALVIGPNKRVTYVPDGVAKDLVGNGSRGYVYAPETKAEPTEAPAPKPAPRKRPARKPKTAE